jgi:hypothetical protein
LRDRDPELSMVSFFLWVLREKRKGETADNVGEAKETGIVTESVMSVYCRYPRRELPDLFVVD